METLRIALLQPDIHWKGPEKNRAMFDELLAAHAGKADVFMLPEMFNTGFVPDPASVAEELHGPTFEWMKNAASRYECAISGSIVIAENNKYYNRFFWVNPDGSHYTYDKRHLFSLGNENIEYTPGENQVIFEFKGWKIKPLICYDLRFPVWARNSFSQGEFGYDILLLTANWPASRRLHWRQLILARAIENQCYAVGVNRRGKDGNGWQYAGGSTLATPDGKWLPESESCDDDVIIVEISKTNLSQYRKSFPFAQDWDGFRVV
ncbi:MAG TPA: nitrilase-related carbon-nitrogen hydrolase [Bacteroidales bacterium]|nr:nitrilase-related carbon-nitrogen hydrolase [Bacteroidales bacterium]